MATERDFITPAGVTVVDTANVVGNTAAVDYFSNTYRASSYPTLSIDFSRGGGNLDPRVTFQRASSATYTAANGMMITVGNNTPRFHYANGVCQGLLMEEGRTNLVYPNFAAYPTEWWKTGTVNGPDGKPMIAFVPPAGTSISFPQPIQCALDTIPTTIGGAIDYCFTIYLGPTYGNATLGATVDVVFQASVVNSNYVYSEWVIDTATMTTTNKTVSAPWSEISSSIVQDPQTGIYKLTWILRYTQDATGRNYVYGYVQHRNLNNGQWIADGKTGIQFACPQFERGGWPTTYIPTTTTSATRAYDFAYVGADEFEYSPIQGTLLVEALTYRTYSPATVSWNDGDALAYFMPDQGGDGRYGLGMFRDDSNATYAGGLYCYNSGPPTFGWNSVTALNGAGAANQIATNTSFKMAVSYYANTFMTCCAIGRSPQTTGNYTGTIGNQANSTLTLLNIGNGYAPAQRTFGGPIKKIVYWNNPLSPSETAAVTL